MARGDQRAKDHRWVPVRSRLPDDFGSAYAQAFSLVHGRMPKARISERAMKQAEVRLGFPVPGALRTFYATLGAERWVMDTYEHINPPSALETADGRLVFCIENQDVCRWSIRVGSDDPIVEQLDVEGTGKWRSTGLSCSAFLVLLVFYQAVLGGHRYSGHHDVSKTLRRTLKAAWEVVVRHDGLTIYLKEGALVGDLAGSEIVYGSARTKADRDKLVELGFKF